MVYALIGIAVWLAVMLLAVALCRAAAAGERVTEAACREYERAEGEARQEEASHPPPADDPDTESAETMHRRGGTASSVSRRFRRTGRAA